MLFCEHRTGQNLLLAAPVRLRTAGGRRPSEWQAGGKRDFAEAYRLFRGRHPDVGPLLEERGLMPAGAEG